MPRMAALGALAWLMVMSQISAREWTDRSGQHRIEAEFVNSDGERVWLKPPDRPTFRVALADLSKTDQEYVRKLLQDEKAARKTRPVGPDSIRYGPGRTLCALVSKRLSELSGMACSRRHPRLFWAHNDSGDEARIYLFDLKGRDLGSCLLAGITAYDLEDMASFTADGKPYLVLADTGNNGLAAAVHMLYVIEEPPCDPEGGVKAQQARLLRTIYFSFEDDHRNCEAMGVDPTDKTILLVSKEWTGSSAAYALAWPKDDDAKTADATNGRSSVNTPPKRALVARRIATLALRLVTGMDVSPDGRRAIVVTYGDAFEYTRESNENWAKALGRPPREIQCPLRLQGESICYGSDGKTLYLSSELRPTPLIEIPVLPCR